MNLLLDTHALIWFSENDPMLSKPALKAIELPSNTRWVSMATLWEMAIKLSIGKLTLQLPLAEIIAQLNSNGFDLLPISPPHVLTVEQLPYWHRDPFDRLIVAQARSEGFTLVSNEVVFDQYGVKRLW